MKFLLILLLTFIVTDTFAGLGADRNAILLEQLDALAIASVLTMFGLGFIAGCK